MVGNSVRSDVLPALEAGASAVHIPYHVTWEHEVAEVATAQRSSGRHHELADIRELPGLLSRLSRLGR
jgi:putative hydrolase of the HAD superfamily